MAGSDGGLAALKKRLKDGQVAGLYVFYGEEDYLRRHYLSLLKKVFDGPMADFNVHDHSAESLTPDQLLAAAESLPVLSDGTMIVVRDLDLGRAGDWRPALEGLFADLPDYLTLVFSYESKEYKPDARQKVDQLIAKHGLRVEFARQGANDLVPWIQRRFKALNREIDARTSEYMLFLCGEGMTSLTGEIEKAAAFTPSQNITRSVLDAVCVPQLSAVVYGLTDAVTDGHAAKALRIYQDLKTQHQDGHAILASLARAIRQLYTAKLYPDGKAGQSAFMKVWGMRSSYPAERVRRAAARRRLGWCRRAVLLCDKTDRDIKTWNRETDAAIEELLLMLLQA
jgi:DNA polymerase-3 subunit delta